MSVPSSPQSNAMGRGADSRTDKTASRSGGQNSLRPTADADQSRIAMRAKQSSAGRGPEIVVVSVTGWSDDC